MSLAVGRQLLNGPAAPRLHALVVGDVTQLCASRWNLGALYLLPECGSTIRAFRLRRAELRGRYRSLPPRSSRNATVPLTQTICRFGWSNP